MAESPHDLTRPRRTRATWITYVQMGLWVWVMYSIGPSIPSINAERPMHAAVLSLFGAGAAIGGIVGGMTVVRLVHRFGRGQVLRMSSFIIILGAIVFTSGLPVWVCVLGPVIAGFGSSLLIPASNSFLTETQGAASAAAITESNVSASIFSIIGPLTIGAGVAMITWGWRFGPWAAAICLVLLEVVRGRNLEPYDAKSGHPDSEKGVDHVHGGKMPRLFWPVALTLICGTIVEFCMMAWGSSLIGAQVDFDRAAAAAALSFLTVGMLVGRFVGSKLAAMLSTEVLLPAAIIVSLLGFALTWLSQSPMPLFIGLAVMGLGMAMHWPIGITRALRASEGRPDRAGGRISVLIGVLGSSGPYLLGLAGESVGVHTAFLIVPIALFVSLLLSVTFRVPDPLKCAEAQGASMTSSR